MTLCAWTFIQPVVSGVQLLCLIYIADIVCMNSNPVCESHVQLFCVISIADIACMNSYAESEPYAALLLDFYCSYCLHELLSRKWVMCSFSAWCPLLTLPAHIACMGFYPACEWLCSSSAWCLLLTLPAWGPIQPVSGCAAPLFDVYCSHCLHGVPSRSWVAVQLLCLISIAHIACMGSHPDRELLCSFSAWYLLLTLPAWGPIQQVSCCAAPLLDIYCSHCLHRVPSRMWVAVQLLCLISIAHIACMGSHPAHELLCSSSAWYLLLTLPAWGPIQVVSCCAASLFDIYCSHCLHGVPSSSWVAVQLLCLMSIADIACMNSHPECELLCSSSAWILLLTLLAWTPIQLVSHVQLLLDFYYWHCLHELPSSQWVFVKLLCLISITDITCTQSHLDSELSTSTQVVLCLIFIAYVYCLVCSYFNVLSSPYSINTHTFYRHLTFAMSLLLNSM